MTLAEWIIIGTIVLLIGSLMSNRVAPDLAMMGALTLLMLADAVIPGVEIITPKEALFGFAHKAVIMIAALFIVAAGLNETGAVESIAQRVLGRPRSPLIAQFRLMGPVAIMSAFMNNTPIVAMYMPIVSDWAKKLRVSPSKLYLPLSYAAILGGACTLIGTSSNVTVNALYMGHWDDPAFASRLLEFGLEPPSATKQFWWITTVGLPAAVVGILFIAIGARWLLPDRRPVSAEALEERQYKVEMLVRPDSPIVGRTIEDAGLRHLPGLYLMEIQRDGRLKPAVGPEEVLQANDLLVFVGNVESVLDLRKIRGLVPETDQVQKIKTIRRNRTLVEAVISNNSPLVGRTVRQSQFRTTYNAAIIAIHRDGDFVKGKIGDIKLRPGDTLLLETHTGFVGAYRNSKDFFLVSQVEGSRPIRHERAGLSMLIMAFTVVMLVTGWLDHTLTVLIAAGAMVATRCCTGTVARNAVNLQVLVVIAAALGIGRAMEQTGAAERLARAVVTVAQDSLQLGPSGLLFVVFALTSVFAQLITNNGSAVLMFPVALGIAAELRVSPEPFVVALMVAAACSFMTPIAYQTNLMVYGPGGYRFTDYLRIGIPLTVITGVLAVVLAPMFFPFTPAT
ncbi:MAG: SLC13 family permease [Phycisphaerales bacterium]